MKKFAPYIVVFIIIAFGIFVWTKDKKDEAVVKDVEQVNVEGVGLPANKEPKSGINSLAALAKEGSSLECQIMYERNESEGDIQGTYFTHNGKLRGDFVIPAPEFGGKIVSSMIVDTDLLFVWTTIEGETLGFKSDLTTRDASIPTKEPISLDAQVKYTCTDWTEVDSSVFLPPTNVKFSDADTAIRAGMEYGVLEN